LEARDQEYHNEKMEEDEDQQIMIKTIVKDESVKGQICFKVVEDTSPSRHKEWKDEEQKGATEGFSPVYLDTYEGDEKTIFDKKAEDFDSVAEQEALKYCITNLNLPIGGSKVEVATESDPYF
jgi:hypothetical protein